MEESTLTSLARAFREGDMRSFERIVDAMTRPLLAAAFRYTGDWESARDLCQDTWLKVYEKIERYDPARPFSTWLHAIHRNGCLSFIRRVAYRREVPVDAARAGTDAVEGMGAAAGDCPDPISEMESREFARRLREAMSHLTERQLDVFTRVDIERFGRAQAAEELGMNEATLRSTLHFARRRLAERLRKMENDTT